MLITTTPDVAIDTARMNSDVAADLDVPAYAALWSDGWDWAYDLKRGDVFRGSYGEARSRGLEGRDATMFHVGASSGLDGWAVICTDALSGRITRLEAK
jgi:hypothetical protein